VPIGIAVIVVITLINLRGIRESGTIFMIPTYAFLVCIGALLIGGIYLVGIGPPAAPRVVVDAVQPVTLVLLLRAFARIASDFRDWGVMFIGDGDERSRLMRLCRDLEVEERVTFAGQRQDVEFWMARAGIVVQPSRFEGFPNVVLASMGMGAAVISSDCASGPADLIEDGVNGRLVPVNDVEALSRVMGELMSPPALRMRLGREATNVRQRFNEEIVMAQWQACLFAGHQRTARDARL
jgi:glycosyltransferase involved in cell wall biosynthesis